MLVRRVRRWRRVSVSRVTDADPQLARRKRDLDRYLVVVAAAMTNRVRDQLARNKQRVRAPLAGDVSGIKDLCDQTPGCSDSSRLGGKQGRSPSEFEILGHLSGRNAR